MGISDNIRNAVNQVVSTLGDSTEICSVILSGITYTNVPCVITAYNSNFDTHPMQKTYKTQKSFRFTTPASATMSPKKNDKIVYLGQTWNIESAQSGYQNNIKWLASLDTTLLVGADKVVGR